MGGHIRHIQISWLGLMPCQQAWRLQSQLAGAIAAGEQPATLLLLEHPHTYTLGRAGSWDNLLWEREQLRTKGIEALQVDRGGDITYHGPGQLIAYPLLPLGQINADGRLPGPDYHGHLRRLEQVIITVLNYWGLSAATIEGLTGVWLKGRSPAQSVAKPTPAKIAAIGIKVDSNGISRHGFALNVDPEMSYWKGIIPCGLSQYPVTSMSAHLDQAPTLPAIRDQVAASFRQVFNCSTSEISDHKLMGVISASNQTTA